MSFPRTATFWWTHAELVAVGPRFALLQLAVTEARLDAESFERVVSQIAAGLNARRTILTSSPAEASAHWPIKPSLWPARARRPFDSAHPDARQLN
jgi:hypothetical protein